MSKLTSKKVLAATVAGLAVAGGGAAIAASQTDSRASSFLDSVAEHLGISSQELEDATKAAALDQVDQALADGRITEEQADELKTRIESGDFPGLFEPGLFELRHGGPDNGGPGPGEHHFFPFGGKLSGAAEYLGLSESELREQLLDGKSLAEIAEAAGKSVDGLKQAVLDAAKAALDEAVERDLLTQEQADSIYERLQGWIDDLVNGTFPGLGRLGFHPGSGGPPGSTPRGGSDDNGGSSGSSYWDTAA
ncbi:MAG: hypothetical protein ACRDMY_02740 [Gaiellaceae bacterium]